MPTRGLPVPGGLDGVRVDAALAKLLGFSRTFAAEVAESGGRVVELVREHVSDDPDSSQVCRMIIDWNA